ncbi:hypothetical protein NX801_14915 [Streptomyces sp. LP05-1]|uniref:DUF4232 domain-containing protein n=1 Tax=Streptomyces pyxinae TaxID=2970734 RepID=A0ABT2CHN8_9ACTN|nr:hypothetical protein [Streptomyces sp. LP05-1]MCS0636927.1 hypothetical protein [Streptomyces sp. LP05-1]
MYARLTSRSGPLSLALAVALSLTVTACSGGHHRSTHGGKGGGHRTSAGGGGSTVEKTTEDSGGDSATGGAGYGTGTDRTPTSSEATSGPGGGGRARRACGTGDLSFTVQEKPQAGGYYLITARARPGIICSLESTPAAVAFGSSPGSRAEAAPDTATGTVRLSGSTTAHAGVNPFVGTPEDDEETGGVQYENIIVSVGDGHPGSVSLKLPGAAGVKDPIASRWHADPADAVPVL